MISYALGYGTRYSFSVIFTSLLEEFLWPRDTTAIMLSIHMLVYGFVAPMAGRLVDRIGPRKTMVGGTVLISSGLAISALGTEPWHFYFSFGVLAGAGLCFIGAVPFITVLRNWFEMKRGLAFSLLTVGTGGGFAFYPAVAYLIEITGWRKTFLIEAIILPVVILPLILFVVRYHPREKGLICDGSMEPKGSFHPHKERQGLVLDKMWADIDWTLDKAIKTSKFWLLCLSTFSIWGMMQHIMVTHHVAFATDLGYTKMYASSVLSLFGFFFIFGCLASSISDLIGREKTVTIGTLCGISGIISLMLMNDTSQNWMLYYYAFSLGFGIGITAPTIAATITDIFQGPEVGTTIGSIWFSFAIGGAIGPWLGGWIFELTHSYEAAFIVAIGWYGVACIAIWLAAPRKIRLVPGLAKKKGANPLDPVF
jgi:MFS family permease